MSQMRVLEGYQKGINLGGWLSQCMSYEKEHFDTFIVEEDIKKITDWGFDHIRLPVDYDVIETEIGDNKEEGYVHIDDCIDWCKKYRLNIVLDLHKSFGYMFDKAVIPDPDKFFTDENLQDRFYRLWEKLVNRYGKNKDCLAFELLNEVVNPDHAETWNRISSKAIEIIRKVEPSIKIVIGGVQHSSVASISLLDPPADENIIYTFHCYEPLCFTHQKAHWVENFDFELSYPANVGTEYFCSKFKEAVNIAEKYNIPLYCGEYGVIDQAPLEDTLRWLTDINTVFAEYKIGRALWSYREMSFGLVDDHYHDIKDKMIQIITS